MALRENGNKPWAKTRVLNIRVKPLMQQALEACAKRRGVSTADIAREAIATYLKRKKT